MFKGQHFLLAKVILLLQTISLIFQALPSQRDCQFWQIKQGGTDKQLDEAGEDPAGLCVRRRHGPHSSSERSSCALLSLGALGGPGQTLE